jgi:hypothetical protein
MPDSSDIDNALVAVLGSDAALLALCPNGVYMNEAPPGSTRFVVITVIDALDVGQFGTAATTTPRRATRAIEDVLYMVEARMLNMPAGGDIKGAARRIDELIEDVPLVVPGYGWMASFRENRERDIEVDSVDVTVRWLRRGGRYRVQMAVGAATTRVPQGSPTGEARVEQ